jgi:hypothetical protein
VLLPDEWHEVDATVACHTANAFVDVDAVVKIHEVGEVRYADPFE